MASRDEISTSSDLIGTTVRNITLRDLLGRGGMGEVYLGWDSKLDRQVAVKTIRRENALNPLMRARFLTEARALSRIEHPNICQIHDYVEGEELDFLVLEHIEGQDLQTTTSEAGDLGSRLDIAIQVADALAAVHAEGIVHRDLKPGNVMLAADGGVKVLDFGLAHRVGQEETSAALSRLVAAGQAGSQPALIAAAAGSVAVRTGAGTIVGTPRHMSPEQARGEAATPASDMYSLGLLLQELMCCEGPYELNLSPRDVLFKAMRAETRAATGVVPELATLITRLKSLAPGARPSAADTVDRLRWIRDSPLRRRRRLLQLAVMIALVLGLVGSTAGLYRARRAEAAANEAAKRASEEAATSERVSQFLIDLFEVSDPRAIGGAAAAGDLTASELLDQGAERLSTELEDEPRIRARLLATVGAVYRHLGQYDKARVQLEQALAQSIELSGPDSVEAAMGMSELAHLCLLNGDPHRAEELYRQALVVRRRDQGDENIDVAYDLTSLAVALRRLGRGDEVEALYRESLDIQRRVLERGSPTHTGEELSRGLVVTLHNLARARLANGDPDGAEELLREALQTGYQVLGPDDVRVTTVIGALAMTLRVRGDLVGAGDLFRQALEAKRRQYPEDHPAVATSLNNLANAQLDIGEVEEAESLYREALQMQRQLLGETHPEVANTLTDLAAALQVRGSLEEADSACSEALGIERRVHGDDHPELSHVLLRRGSVALERGDLSAAEGLLDRARVVGRELPERGRSGRRTAAALVLLAELEMARGDPPVCEQPAREAVEILGDLLGPDHWRTAATEAVLGACLSRHGRRDEGERLLERGLAAVIHAAGDQSPHARRLERYRSE